MAIQRPHTQDRKAFVDALIRHAEEAVQFHGQMSGKAALREAFVRDWIAVKLYKENKKYGVNLEVRRDEFCGFLKDKECPEPLEVREAFDALPRRKEFLDMVLFCDGYIHSIIELKMKLEIEEDVERTRGLLSIFKRPVFGYQIVCIVRGEDDVDDEVKILKERVKKLGNACASLRRGTKFQAGDENGFCCICVVPVIPAGG